MREYLLLLLSTVLVNNVVLVKFLGLCPFMGISKKTDTAVSMGLATTFVMTMASASCWMLEHWLLVPLGMVYLRILVYILVIAVVVQFTEMVVRKTNPALYQVLGIYLPHLHNREIRTGRIANPAGWLVSPRSADCLRLRACVRNTRGRAPWPNRG